MKKRVLVSSLLVSLVLLLTSHSCDKKTTTDDSLSSAPAAEMGQLSFEFKGNYSDMWKQVDSLQREGRYQTALDVVNVIFDSARTADNTPQVVKSVIHKMKFNSYMAEDDYVVAIDELNKIASDASFPLKQIIHSVTAEVYWGYYQNNQWKFVNRTHTVNYKREDIRTWDLTTLADHVIKQYRYSLSSPDSLQHSKTSDFNDMLVSYGEDDLQRPTLYDFLANRALNFFETSDYNLSRPADHFKLTGEKYFGSTEDFLSIKIDSKDSLSNELYAVQLFQILSNFHKNDSTPEALADLELRRLRFVRSHSKEENKDQLYSDALDQLSEKYVDHHVWAEVIFYKAQYLRDMGQQYTEDKPEHQWKIKEAHELCGKVIEKYENSYGADLCKTLKNEIESKNLSIELEPSIVPNTPYRALVSYTNIDRLYFRLIKIDWDFHLKNRRYYGEELMEKYLAITPEKEWMAPLKNPGDFRMHSMEISPDGLSTGQYVLLASNHKDFQLTGNAIAHGSFWATNLSYLYKRNNDNQTYEVTVLNRETGSPINGVKAQIYESKYNYGSRSYQLVKKESYTSDNNGQFVIKSPADYRNVYIDLSYKKEHYNNARDIYQYRHHRNDPKPYITTNFFLDRGIYRPGQAIHFKGIVIKHDDDKHEIQKRKSGIVSLFDVNGQKVSDLKYTTNEFGSFSGTFTAPTGVLNGQMHIRDGNGTKYFSVEEYKRPKFEVEFPPIEGVYKLGQTIKVTGTAKAFAGSNIDGADVQYRVTRSATFPYWGWYRWGFYPYSTPMEITNGTIKSDEKGEFIIEFKAEEDQSINRKYSPIYTYTVSADVTDINGETHSNSQYVMVGVNAMNLSVSVGSEIDLRGNDKVKVNTSNLNGQKVDATGKITVHRLKEPEKPFRSTYWSRPDIETLSKEEFYKRFPHDYYDKENQIEFAEKEKEVLSIPFNTKENDSVRLNGFKSWGAGRYIMEATCIDEFGEEVKDVRYFTVFDTKAKKNATNELWKVIPVKTYVEPGENAEFLISSGATNTQVLFEIETKKGISMKKRITLSKSQQLISIPIKEEHRGNIVIKMHSVKHNRMFTYSSPITVPYSNKTLDIEFETFRNKLLPGQKEEWKVKIKGPKGEKVAAEMLCAMYDASLDEFASNYFSLNVFTNFYNYNNWSGSDFNVKHAQLYQKSWNNYRGYYYRNYDQLNWFGHNMSYLTYQWDYGDAIYFSADRSIESEEMMIMESSNATSTVVMDAENNEDYQQGTFGVATGGTAAMNGLAANQTKKELSKDQDYKAFRGNVFKTKELSGIKARTNLSETAFFYPHLATNEKGEVEIKFTIPEALTRWKFMGLAHTQDLKSGTITENVITQKKLMITPNAPRFFREGDQMTFTAKVSNLTEEDFEGTAQLLLFDALTMKPVDELFNNTQPLVDFEAKKGQSARLAWNIKVPDGINAVTYRVVAKAKDFTDGEEMAVPVLTNRMLVTESLPLPSKGKGTTNFKFKKLIESGSSTSLKHHKLTLEYTSNPAWYAVQAMPYMMEYPYECAEQTFTRYYANALASHIVNSSPKIKTVFENWKSSSPDAFLSNLEKNQELKSLMLEETPWVMNAQNESERKKRVALLFDLNKMDNELNKAMRKLQKAQVSNGGWPWFPGMPESRYITQHIVTGMGHLDVLGVKSVKEDHKIWNMVKKGVGYLDQRLIEDYRWVLKHYPDTYLSEQHIGQIQIQYLYARSYFKELPIKGELKEAFDYYQKQAATYWTKFGLYNEGMIALQAHRFDNPTLAKKVLLSIKERALMHDELGMYWKDNVGGYYWYQAPIETQALLIEAFDEVNNDQESVEEMKVWLLKQKQTTDWKTTKATAEACYALLLRGTELLENDEMVEIKVNNQLMDPAKLGAKVEAGTGYFKTSWTADKIKPEMGNVSVTRKTEGVSWGAMYWQYFEDLDKITPHDTPLKLEKKLFLVVNTASGPVIKPISEETSLSPGDKVRVRIELRTDRNLEYVHMKDMRASSLEPVQVISKYRWQDGLGYYQSTKDASTNFFMDRMNKGTYVFEYDLRVTHFGEFSNGITTIQCMYAPEFTSHSEGIRIKVKE